MALRVWILLMSMICFLLLKIDAVEIPRDTSYTVLQSFKKLQKKYPDISPATTDLPPAIIVNRDVIYSSFSTIKYGVRSLTLDVFQPKTGRNHPAIIMVHGGGWRSGNKSMEAAMAIRLAQAGFVAVPVEYRLSLEAKYPAAVTDIKAAIKWIKLNADRFAIDTTKIAIEGNSAGGQLATLVGMTNGLDKFDDDRNGGKVTSRVNAVIDIDGVVDFLAPLSLNMPRTGISADVAWIGATFEENPQRWKEASPIFYVNEKSVPVLFVNSSQHRFHAGEDEMVGLLRQYGVSVAVEEIPDAPHTFWLFHPWHNHTVESMIGFLNLQFR